MEVDGLLQEANLTSYIFYCLCYQYFSFNIHAEHKITHKVKIHLRAQQKPNNLEVANQ